MSCHYCRNEAIGVNYRPKPELDNALSCQQHQTLLFIPFQDKMKQKKKPRQFFNRLIEDILAEFNLLKSEIHLNCSEIDTLNPENAQNYIMKCQTTNPYMVINDDQDLMMAAFVGRLQARYKIQKNKQKRESIGRKRAESQSSICNKGGRSVVKPKAFYIAKVSGVILTPEMRKQSEDRQTAKTKTTKKPANIVTKIHKK